MEFKENVNDYGDCHIFLLGKRIGWFLKEDRYHFTSLEGYEWSESQLRQIADKLEELNGISK